MPDAILTADMLKVLDEGFAQLTGEVTLHVFTKPGKNEQYNQIVRQLIAEISAVSKKIKPFYHDIGKAEAERYGVQRSPTVLVSPEKYNIRFTGAPLGEEGRSLVVSIIMASTGKTIISDDSRLRLKRVKEKRHVRVFVSPSCPYCPQQFLYAVSAAIEVPALVSAESIEIGENRDLAEKYSAMSVPRTFIGEVSTSQGLEPEESFMESVVLGRHEEHILPAGREELKDYDIVILGGGPAGLTAAIYAERSGLKTIILERTNLGGQISITPIVENYPSFQQIEGRTLVELMSTQAMQYASVFEGVGVKDIKKTPEGFFELATSRGPYRARAIILATGADNKHLGVPGEARLAGLGVSYCSTCDGYLFKDGMDVLVVGGGNSALTDALYLDGIGAHVSIVHRRDRFRAEDRLQQTLFKRNIQTYMNTRVTEILGDTVVKKATLQDVNTGKTKSIKTDGVFIAVGYTPNNELAKKLGAEIVVGGYVKTDTAQRTSVPLIYAAGDLTGGVKQIAVATGQGSVAAISAFEDLSDPYWKKT